MKYYRFRKQLLMETAVIAALLAVLGGIAFFVGSFSDGYHQENEAKQREVDTIKADMEGLKTKYMNIKQDATLYQEVQQRQLQNQLAINRQGATSKFNQLKTDYLLGNMRLSISPVQEMSDKQYQRKTSAVSFSEVTANLDALSDEYVYDMIVKMQQELAGVTKITKITMQRQQTLTDDMVRTISIKGPQPLIKTEIRFTWYGIGPVDPTDTDKNARKKKP